MTSVYQMVKSYIVKKSPEQVAVVTKETESNVVEDLDEVKENEANDLESNKKTDEQAELKAQSGGIIWHMSSEIGSGLYNVSTGAIGYGVGGVKWVAAKGYDVGATVVSHVKVPVIPKFKKQKDKMYLNVNYQNSAGPGEKHIGLGNEGSCELVTSSKPKVVMDVPDYMYLSLLAIFICVPFGLAALQKSLKVRQAMQLTNSDVAIQESNSAIQHILMALFLGPLVAITIFLMAFLPTHS